MENYSALCTISAVLWFISLIVITITCKNFCSKRKTREISQKLNCLSVALFSIALFGGFCWFYAYLFCALHFFGISLPDIFGLFWFLSFYYLGNICIILQFDLICILFVLRLKVCFAGTVYDYPSWFYSIFIIVIIMIPFIAFGSVIGIRFMAPFAAIMSIIICIILTYFFIYGLKKIMKNTEDSNPKLIELMIKYIVLVSLSMTSSTIFCVFLFLHSIFYSNHEYVQNYWGLWMWDWFWPSIDSLINMLCIYLQFSFAEAHYFKLLGQCHNLCRLLFLKQNKSVLQLTTMHTVCSNSSTNTKTSNVSNTTNKTDTNESTAATSI